MKEKTPSSEKIRLRKANCLVRSNYCLKTALYNDLIFYQNILFKGETYSGIKMLSGGKANGI